MGACCSSEVGKRAVWTSAYINSNNNSVTVGEGCMCLCDGLVASVTTDGWQYVKMYGGSL